MSHHYICDTCLVKDKQVSTVVKGWLVFFIKECYFFTSATPLGIFDNKLLEGG